MSAFATIDAQHGVYLIAHFVDALFASLVQGGIHALLPAELLPLPRDGRDGRLTHLPVTDAAPPAPLLPKDWDPRLLIGLYRLSSYVQHLPSQQLSWAVKGAVVTRKNTPEAAGRKVVEAMPSDVHNAVILAEAICMNPHRAGNDVLLPIQLQDGQISRRSYNGAIEDPFRYSIEAPDEDWGLGLFATDQGSPRIETRNKVQLEHNFFAALLKLSTEAAAQVANASHSGVAAVAGAGGLGALSADGDEGFEEAVEDMESVQPERVAVAVPPSFHGATETETEARSGELSGVQQGLQDTPINYPTAAGIVSAPEKDSIFQIQALRDFKSLITNTLWPRFATTLVRSVQQQILRFDGQYVVEQRGTFLIGRDDVHDDVGARVVTEPYATEYLDPGTGGIYSIESDRTIGHLIRPAKVVEKKISGRWTGTVLGRKRKSDVLGPVEDTRARKFAHIASGWYGRSRML